MPKLRQDRESQWNIQVQEHPGAGAVESDIVNNQRDTGLDPKLIPGKGPGKTIKTQHTTYYIGYGLIDKASSIHS